MSINKEWLDDPANAIPGEYSSWYVRHVTSACPNQTMEHERASAAFALRASRQQRYHASFVHPPSICSLACSPLRFAAGDAQDWVGKISPKRSKQPADALCGPQPLCGCDVSLCSARPCSVGGLANVTPVHVGPTRGGFTRLHDLGLKKQIAMVKALKDKPEKNEEEAKISAIWEASAR
jgi:hypothetical protein